MYIKDNSFFRDKVQEYLNLTQYLGFINLDDKQSFKEQLLYLKLKKLRDNPGDAMLDNDTLYFCVENMNEKCQIYGKSFIDEVLFHEFSHVINDLHQSVVGYQKGNINDFIVQRMKGTSPSLLLESNALLYNQDPRKGLLLLDEYVAQRISQDVVSLKNKYSSSLGIKDYLTEKGLNYYRYRDYITKIGDNPITIKTAFAAYQEFDICAQRFMKKYGYDDYNDFIKLMLTPGGLKHLIIVNRNRINELYIDLCYLAIIRERVYYTKGLIEIADKNDPAMDPKKVGIVLKRILQ